MKKIITLVVALAATLSSFAWEYQNPGFEWSAGCDFTTTYLWRGMKNGGMAFQPGASVGYGGLAIEAWANIGAIDNTFREFDPELDVTLRYKIAGLTLGYTHYYYFDGTKYFGYGKPTVEEYKAEEQPGCQGEVFAKFEFGEFWEKVPLTVTWSTFVAGDDWKPELGEAGDTIGVERAFSSYLEVSFKANLPLGFSLTPTVGMTPWKSFYSNYEQGFSVNNISLRADWELNVKDIFTLDVYGIVMLNTAGLNKDNVWPAVKDSYNNQRLNLAAGVGIWF